MVVCLDGFLRSPFPSVVDVGSWDPKTVRSPIKTFSRRFRRATRRKHGEGPARSWRFPSQGMAYGRYASARAMPNGFCTEEKARPSWALQTRSTRRWRWAPEPEGRKTDGQPLNQALRGRAADRRTQERWKNRGSETASSAGHPREGPGMATLFSSRGERTVSGVQLWISEVQRKTAAARCGNALQSGEKREGEAQGLSGGVPRRAGRAAKIQSGKKR